MKLRTKCATGRGRAEEPSHPLVPPIVASSTFRFESQQALEDYYASGRGYLYSRYGNPTVRTAERLLADLEEAEDAALFASGMAAITTTLLSLVRAGQKVAAQREVYGGTAHLFLHVLPELGIEVVWLSREELNSLSARRLAGCRALYVESPINPTLGIVDLRRTATVSKESGIPVIVDSTFATPVLQRPLELGCDLVLHSGTKYLGGHSDLTAGGVAGPSDRIDGIRKMRRTFGGVLDPFQAFLLHRGMRTLAVRMEAHEQGARAVAEALRQHSRVTRVLWPGLAEHEDHALAAAQMAGFGGMVTFEVAGGASAAERVHDRLELFSRAPSLGGIDSLASIPARVSHRYLDEEEQRRVGVTPGMIRLSVGLEAPDDLVADLNRALGSSSKKSPGES